MLWIILAIIISYFIGSIPTAYIFGWVIKGADIRKFGSGNVGATNALRLLGKGWGMAILVLDILKGFLPVILLGDFLVKQFSLTQAQNLFIIIGLSCICGHNWTIFLKFKGGKGVATTLGVLLGLTLKIPGLNIVLGFTALVWFASFLALRIISLSSILAALSFPLFTILFRQSAMVVLAGILLSIFIILRHKSNIKRLLEGKENRISFRK
ncbi:MAG: acyl-phosphate glycerol 3-phosphate acyltransferase [Candidatus Omnitrophica bacterium CG08_land_8_20_14_0_20_41_16]|uniref:Glycerol-3-phosphate acyltransferase n=1 Tax=Candidatus Sherwoodlollariibacterium unditelluris TaxID=1974757 RepID=A0A2G9YHY6_9BACT|nr:MAG: acyl-phosphate glycerol 3-phosphate acyltransferase [Candidatus Omnitrophica bacterium CG23_combo_of_CG06-09_8_20_14_all_41_10]PIS34509.1 MAG: acyl-phosphate glycerol 3-phosphate acyltransferase [Candidatus Omnitrophica bacterium CG08_land_8_20_14_0_20_41_16]